MMEKNAKIYVAGHRGMVGSAIVRELKRQGYENIITRTHKELDLCRQDAVEAFFAEEKPEYVFLAAAKVGGIVANQEALADFMYDNMVLEMNVIHAAWQNGCKKLEFLGSSCIYPRMAPQPMKESCLLTSELEKTNEAYALAKISGLKYCEFLNRQYGTDYISVMPTLANYAAFENRGFVLKGLFDVNPRLAGLTIRGVEIRMMDELKDFVKENDIEIGVLTIPKTKAVEVANLLVDNGVKAIWNFAHTDLNLPDNIIVENVHLSESLMRLSYNITRYNEEHEGK